MEGELVALREHFSGIRGRQQGQPVEGELKRGMGNGERSYGMKAIYPLEAQHERCFSKLTTCAESCSHPGNTAYASMQSTLVPATFPSSSDRWSDNHAEGFGPC